MTTIYDKADQLLKENRITPQVYTNLERWYNLDRHRREIERLLEEEKIEELTDAFSQTIPFGTGGRRGKMGIGPNGINIFTIRDSAQGVMNYLREAYPSEEASVVIAYDTRHKSDDFAQAAACVFAANDVQVYLYDAPRSTPQLSYSVRHLKTTVGVMISASHNPPTDNGIKIYWRDGAQVVSPHDRGIIAQVERVEEAHTMPFQVAQEKGKIEFVGSELDEAYLSVLEKKSLFPGERDLTIAFSPLHGVGATNGAAILERVGFEDLHLVEKQCTPDGDFPHVARNIPNPEEPSAMEEVLDLGSEKGAHIAMATDPDADRLGVGVKTKEGWRLLIGNEIGILIAYHLLKSLKERGELPNSSCLIKTYPTTSALSRIGEHFGVVVYGQLLVGFKYIAYYIENLIDEEFLFGTEESHGYLLGSEVRDKDGAMAALAMAEIAAHLKKEGKTLVDSLEEIYKKVGYVRNLNRPLRLPGTAGRLKIEQLMESFRQEPPSALGDRKVLRIEDHLDLKIHFPQENRSEPFQAEFTGNMLVFHLESEAPVERAQFILRPSGTEPKIKSYFELAGEPGAEDFEAVKGEIDTRTEELAEEVLEILKKKMDRGQ